MTIHMLNTINTQNPVKRLKKFIDELIKTIGTSRTQNRAIYYKVRIPGNEFFVPPGKQLISYDAIVTILLDIQKLYPVQSYQPENNKQTFNDHQYFCCYYEHNNPENRVIRENLNSRTDEINYTTDNGNIPTNEVLIMDFLGILIHEQLRFTLIDELIKTNKLQRCNNFVEIFNVLAQYYTLLYSKWQDMASCQRKNVSFQALVTDPQMLDIRIRYPFIKGHVSVFDIYSRGPGRIINNVQTEIQVI